MPSNGKWDKKLGQYTKPLKDMRKRLPYEIYIKARLESVKIRAFVSIICRQSGKAETEFQFPKDLDVATHYIADDNEFSKNAPVLSLVVVILNH